HFLDPPAASTNKWGKWGAADGRMTILTRNSNSYIQWLTPFDLSPNYRDFPTSLPIFSRISPLAKLSHKRNHRTERHTSSLPIYPKSSITDSIGERHDPTTAA